MTLPAQTFMGQDGLQYNRLGSGEVIYRATNRWIYKKIEPRPWKRGFVKLVFEAHLSTRGAYRVVNLMEVFMNHGKNFGRLEVIYTSSPAPSTDGSYYGPCAKLSRSNYASRKPLPSLFLLLGRIHSSVGYSLSQDRGLPILLVTIMRPAHTSYPLLILSLSRDWF